jgi:glycosyltransferase involved in cell wall biosynthesis
VKAHIAKDGDQTLDTGVQLHIVHGPGYRSNVSMARFMHHGRVAREIKKSMEAHKGLLPNLIVAPIPTIENLHVVEQFAKKYNVPYIIDVRDHWPQDLVNRFPRLVRPLARVGLNKQFVHAKHAAKNALGIAGVTKMQRDYGLKLAGRPVDSKRDHVFYLGYERTPISAPARNEALNWWRTQGLKPDAKIIAFTGTIGVSFDFSAMIAAARSLKAQGRNDIQFVIAGDGGARAGLIKDAGALAGDTVLLPGWIDQPRLDALLSTSTAALAPYIPGTSMSLPNKFFEYMAYGLPVLSSCSGESEAIIATHCTGLQYDPKDHAGFLSALLQLTDNADEARKMGEYALELFEKRFEQNRLFADMEQYMIRMVGK